MGIGTLRRHYETREATPETGVVSEADAAKPEEAQYSPARPSKDARTGVGTPKGKKTPQKAGATAGNGGSR